MGWAVTSSTSQWGLKAFFCRCLFINSFSLQCSDTVGWVTGRASTCKNVGCWFDGDDDLDGVLRASVVTTTSIILTLTLRFSGHFPGESGLTGVH